MDEDLGVKEASVTRLRRRLSVEAEDSPLPTTPSTPTKKRSTRLAAKPQLELINEVVTEDVPKKTTRKAPVKENETEATTGTPIPVTPSRRSTRIRSNTSILSEATTQNIESPRAKRALRRNSQLGSDTESAAVTPARQTKRTRKDSTTSVDKPAGTNGENVVLYVVTSTNDDPIKEEPEKETTNDSKANKIDGHSPSTRKSPRLSKQSDKTDETDNVNKDIDKIKKNAKYVQVSITPIKSNLLKTTYDQNDTSSLNVNEKEKEKLSTSGINLMNELKTNEKKSTLIKSTSAIERIANDLKNKRNRTKSWTTLSSSSNVSDNEGAKEKIMQTKTPNKSMSGSGDGLINDGNKNVSKNVKELDIKSPNKSINKSKSSLCNTSVENKENHVESFHQFAESEMHKNDIVKLFENSPEKQQPLVVIEDSDTCSVDKLSIDIQMEGDQCVPVVANPKKESPTKGELSVEPMDIDESMPLNVTIDDFSDKSNTSKEEAEVPNKRKSSVSEKSLLKDESIQKSKRSSVSQSASEKPIRLSIDEEGKKKSSKDSSIYVQDKLIDATEDEPSRSSSFSAEESRKSLDKSEIKSSDSIGKENVEKIVENSNKSKRKSSVSQNNSKINQYVNESSKSWKSQRESSFSIDDKNIKNSDKSKRKSSISQSEIYQRSILDLNNDNKSPNKLKRTASVSKTESPNLDKSENENKSTLVISQFKDVSTSDTNNVKSPNVTNNLSKSMIGREVKNNGIDKKNLSLNYLTSTPIQQKPLQKLTMQINTSIISPTVENKNNASEITPQKNYSTDQADSDSLDGTDEEIKFKNEKQSVIAPKKKLARALSSSESSGEESETEAKSQSKPAIEKSPNKKVPDLDSSDSEVESETEPKSQSKSAIKKSPNKKEPDLDSSDSEQESETKTKSQSKPAIKKSPNKKVPDLGSSDSEEESETEPKSQSKFAFNKSPNKQVPNLNSLDLEEEPETELKTRSNPAIKTPPNKKVPALDSSDLEKESETDSKTPSKSSIKNSPNIKVPAFNSSNSSTEESDSKSIQTKKTPNKKLNNDWKAKGKKLKTIKKTPASDISDTDDSDEEDSKYKSKLLDDEAFEASDDYESGDSQDEKDRRYEAENEIVEKGETLDSEEECSNDSDYEKDSFLVSSDDEDKDMLSGTGDDLTLSDNELTMAAKSKKKFNERKLKQQKKASREMYEARHKNESANSSKSETAKSKKNKRQRLESSTLESENEDTQPKKNSRPRIDSSQDSLVSDADKSIGIKKKKTKRLSESNDITMNEKEITVLNESIENIDPLSHAIKQERKTPQRRFSISTVAINDNIEEVQVVPTASLLRQNETLDPLQASVAAEDVDSSSSDNTEIIQNFDSVLNNLSMLTKKVKTVDTSLNLNKKAKDSKNPVIDQLNLTQTKKSKKNKDKHTESAKSKAKEHSKADKDHENSSDSIDMKLLFPEDSNDSEVNASQFKPVNEVHETAEDFIPLKRTEAKTNLHENMDMSKPTNDSALNVNIKKNKNRKSSQSALDIPNQLDVTEEPEDSGIKIFMDTTGTRQGLDTSQVHTNSNKKKKNKKNKSLNGDTTALESAVDIDCTDGIMETPVESSFFREKKTKKNKSIDVSVNDESHSEKKSKKKSDSKPEFDETRAENTDNTVIEEFPLNISIRSDKKNKKDKNNVSINIELVDTQSHSAKKKSKKTSISVDNVESQTLIPDSEELPTETLMKSEKKKKKNKHNLEVSQTIVYNAGEESDEAPMEMSYKSEKKSDAADTVTDDALTASSEKKKHKKNKKKNKNKHVSQSIETSGENEKTIEQDDDGPKKRKRKASGNASAETQDVANLIPVESLTTTNEKKKRKILLDDECVAADNNTGQKYDDGNISKKSKKYKSKRHENIEQDEVPQRNAKKRKNMDGDSEETVSKVSKQNSFDKIHVPRLPESILNHLSDKPENIISKKKRANFAIATMPFMVEKAAKRKNKPSNYLEQSVYLNDSPVNTKGKCSKHRPKVLPFTPTALTSDSGYTSQFNINVLPKETQFVAQASNVENFRESFLSTQRIKKLGTFERCKIQRSHKISKF